MDCNDTIPNLEDQFLSEGYERVHARPTKEPKITRHLARRMSEIVKERSQAGMKKRRDCDMLAVKRRLFQVPPEYTDYSKVISDAREELEQCLVPSTRGNLQLCRSSNAHRNLTLRSSTTTQIMRENDIKNTWNTQLRKMCQNFTTARHTSLYAKRFSFQQPNQPWTKDGKTQKGSGSTSENHGRVVRIHPS